jgi:GDPmannose 4,6-dehydratase
MLAVRRDRPFDASAKVRRWMASRRALVIGIAGQDGSLLAELLLAEGYEVFGVVRQPISTQFPNLVEIRDELELSQADVLDELSLVDVLTASRPDEVYNLAAPSFVPMSWRQPVLTAEFAAVGCTALLEAIRRVDSDIRFYQASSSEIFGEPREVPQHEETPLAPVTPYGVAKAYAHFITRSYRRRYGLHASSGILYNHESPRRPLDFVTRKVSHAAAAINLGIERDVSLGDLDARRDWGYAGDYVRAMWLMLQQPEPDDYVIASGESHSVRELVDRAFSRAGLDWEEHVRIDDSLVRGKAELHDLVGDPSRARERLGWSPTVDFDELVNLLVDSDLERLRAELEQTGVAVE